MHPNPAYDWDDAAEMLAFVRERAFAHVLSAGQDGLYVAHAPMLVTGEGRIRFHLFRNNRAASHFSDRPVLISVTALDGYHSANWYVSADQVPTWHYQAVEIDGVARMLSQDELADLLDELTAEFEGRFSPDSPWTRAKMAPGKFAGALKALVGFEVEPEQLRGTRKFNQHKSQADVRASAAGQLAAGRPDIADAIERHWPRG